MLCLQVHKGGYVTVRHNGAELRIYVEPAGSNRTKVAFSGSREFEIVRGDAKGEKGGEK